MDGVIARLDEIVSELKKANAYLETLAVRSERSVPEFELPEYDPKMMAESALRALERMDGLRRNRMNQA